MLSVPHGYWRGRSRWWWLGLTLWAGLEGCRKKRWDDEVGLVSAQPNVVWGVDAQARDVFHKHWQLDARLAKFVERLQKVLFRSTVFVHYQLLVFTPEYRKNYDLTWHWPVIITVCWPVSARSNHYLFQNARVRTSNQKRSNWKFWKVFLEAPCTACCQNNLFQFRFVMKVIFYRFYPEQLEQFGTVLCSSSTVFKQVIRYFLSNTCNQEVY